MAEADLIVRHLALPTLLRSFRKTLAWVCTTLLLWARDPENRGTQRPIFKEALAEAAVNFVKDEGEINATINRVTQMEPKH